MNPRPSMSPILHVAPIPDAPAAEAARFIVGQDPEGHWIALEIHGRAGGLFRTREAAFDYAEDETAHRPDAVRLAAECIALRL